MKIVCIILSLFVGSVASAEKEKPVIELKMNGEVLPVKIEPIETSEVVEGNDKETQVTSVSDEEVIGDSTEKKSEVANADVKPENIVAANKVQTQKIEPIVVPIIVQPVVAPAKTQQVKTVEPAKKETELKPKSENVKVKKTKDGKNVYNFNFYNSKNEKKKAKTQAKAEDPFAPTTVRTRPVRVRVKGAAKPIVGPNVETALNVSLADGDNDFDDSGASIITKAFFRIGSREAGFYVSPGFVTTTFSGGMYFDDTHNGFALRVGKIHDVSRRFSFDFSLEYNNIKGDGTDYDNGFVFDGLMGGSFFNSLSYERKYQSLSFNFSPMFRWNHFQIYFPLSLGYSQSEMQLYGNGSALSSLGVSTSDGSDVIESEGILFSAGLGLGLTF